MRSTLLHRQVQRRLFSTSRTWCQPNSKVVELAFSRHDPPGPPKDETSSMIVMHGLFGSQRNNRTFSKVLAKELSRPIYNVDLRNHGATAHDPTHTYMAMAEDVENFISEQKLHNPVLIGHSMGAKVAMTCALRRPSEYSGIVPLDNAPVDAALKSDFGKYVRGMQEIENHQPRITKQKEADEILQNYESNIGIRQFLLTNFLKKQSSDPNSSVWQIALPTLAKSLDYMADFPFKDPDEVRFEGPCLVVRGSESHYVADETIPVLGRFFPRFELVEIKGSGHWVVSERFEEVVTAVVEWTRRAVDGGQ